MTDLAALARFVHIASVVLFAGSQVFAECIVRPACRRAGIAQDAGAGALLSGSRRISLWALVAAIVSAFAALWIQAMAVGGPGGINAGSGSATGNAVMPLLTRTLYGNVWLGRMAIAMFLLVYRLSAPRGGRDGERRGRIDLVLGACLLGSLGLTGHAAAGDGAERVIQSVADILHLLAAGAWVGALVPLGFALLYFNRMPGDDGAPLSREVTQRFSMLGIASVSTLLLTGVINTWILVGGIPQLVGTTYGHLLLLKLFLLLPMLAVAAVNLLGINPVITGDSGGDSRRRRAAIATLSRNAFVEALLGAGILAIVGLLGTTPPGLHVQPDWPLAIRWDWASLDATPKAHADVEAGLAWGVLGLFVLQFAFLSRRFRVISASLGSALLVYGGFLVSANVATDAYPDTYRQPAVAYNAISIAGGKRLYEKNCLACHGAAGHGDGPASEGLLPRPADLTGSHANSHTVGDLFWWISKGIPNTPMKGFEDRLSEDDRWDAINFVRVLSAVTRARTLSSVIEDHPWLVAPDFAYATSTGENSALKDKRGDKLVLLVIAAGGDSESRLKTLEAAAPRLGAAGVEIIVVPPERGIGGGTRLPLVTEGNIEILATYALFAEGVTDGSEGNRARHAEYLIDKQGYLRARWRPDESDAWSDPVAITVQAERLLKEIPLQLAPEDHVH